MNKNKNVVNNLLELVGNTPMVKIDNLTRDFAGTFLAKLESANPGHSSKDRIALHIVESAERLMEKMKFSKDQNFNKFIFTEKGGHNGFHGIQGCWGEL